MIAQRVSAGFHPPMNTQPQRGDKTPSPHEHENPIASPEHDNAPEHESDKPQSLKAAKSPSGRAARPANPRRTRRYRDRDRHRYRKLSDIFARPPCCPKLIFTPRRRAEVGIPLHHRFPRCARSRCSNARPRLRSREQRCRLLPAVAQWTAQLLQTIRNGIVLRMRGLAALAPLRISMAAYL